MPQVVLPVLNEAGVIDSVLSRLPRGYEPIVVDNGSTDGSADIARRLGARVVLEHLRGFGAACFAGLASATDDIVCFMDCDGSLDAGELPLVVNPIMAQGADLVVGARRAERGAWPRHARLANRFLAFELRRRTGLTIRDIGPMRAARREALVALDLQDRRFGWPLEMLLRAGEKNLQVAEVAVTYRPRVGKSKVTGTALGTLRAMADMSSVLR